MAPVTRQNKGQATQPQEDVVIKEAVPKKEEVPKKVAKLEKKKRKGRGATYMPIII